MEKSLDILTPEQVRKVFDVLMGTELGVNLYGMRNRSLIMKAQLTEIIRQNPETYSIIQDYIIDLETAQEAIEDVIQSMCDLSESTQMALFWPPCFLLQEVES